MNVPYERDIESGLVLLNMFDWLLNLMTGLAGQLGNWMVSPWLLLGGALLVGVPIIIHLLNKRKFKTVEWAAIDFLLEADKKNRRRIRLENLLLLLLRCLAVLLLALLVARPYRPATFAGGVLQSVRFERIVVLDDSLSMQVYDDGRSAFDVAKQSIADLVTGLGSTEADESFSLLLLSRPERPAMSGVHLSDQTAAELSRELQALECSDLPVRLADGLLAVEKMLRNEPEHVNRVIYVFSDLRQRDWTISAANEQPKSATDALRRIANRAAGCYVVDAGSETTSNLTITDVSPREKVLVAGVTSQFDVTVRNHGSREARNVPVRFTAGQSLPLVDTIDRIPAGSAVTVPFTFTFARPDRVSNTEGTESVRPEAIPVAASFAREGTGDIDHLLEDNERFYAARVASGIRTLIVDGDPSAAYGRAESFSLQRALAPPGDIFSGIRCDVVTDVEFDSVRLDDYHVVYLCNLYRLTDQRRVMLEAWVRGGGGLVVFPGDQIDEHVYNETLYRDGDGLMPVRLDRVLGDETEEKWVSFRGAPANHPALQIFAGENNPFVEWVKVFRWWGSSVDQAQLRAGDVVVTAHFSDAQKSPAVVERKMATGRVLVFTTPADRDWNNWPLDASYVIALQELTRYMVNKANREGTLAVGSAIRHPLDLTEYRLEATLKAPRGETTPLEPKPAPEQSGPQDETRWLVDYPRVERRGFYQLELRRTNGVGENTLFAANVDAAEGDLQRVDPVELRRSLQDTPIQIVTADKLTGLAARGAEGELWPLILCFAVAMLCGEQTLAWIFGKKRS